MGDKIINNILQDDEETEVLETLSLTDFPITQHHNVSTFQDHRNSPSLSSTGDFFEFFRADYSEEKMMAHAEDIIFCGKLVPINEQHQLTKIPQQSEKHHHKNQPMPTGCRRSRSESTSAVKSITTSPLIRNSRSLDHKRLNRNSSMSSEPAPEIRREGSGKKSSSRWYVFFFGLVKVPPPEMDLRDMKNRQVRRSSSESCDVIPVSRSVDHRKCSSGRVLGFLSCKSADSAAVTTPLRYMPKV